MAEQAPVALITGGSRGIGAATARAFAKQGYDIAVCCHSQLELAGDVARHVRDLGQRSVVLTADVRLQDDCARLVDECSQQLGSPTVVVSGATGVPNGTLRSALVPSSRTPTLDASWEGFSQALDARAGALLALAQAAVPRMPIGGVLLALTSLGSQRVVPGYGVTGVAMAAVESLVRYLAVELGPRGIRVNAVCGGVVDTDALSLVATDPEALKSYVAKLTPLGRVATPEDIAELLVALASPGGGWMTGQTVIADGGVSLRT